jgi:hypothetical protein
MSRTVAVIIGAHTTDRNNWKCIRESAHKLEVPLHVIGVGTDLPPDPVQSFRETIDYINHLPDDYVLVTDGFDTTFSRWDEGEVIRLIDNSLNNWFISCNEECWPGGAWCDSYTDRGTPWWSACGGGFAGTKHSMLRLLEEFLSGRWPYTGGGNQEMLHEMHAARVPMTLDTRCQVYQVMMGISQPLVKYQAGLAYNTVTQTYPMILHFAGGSANQPSLHKWHNRLWGAR